MQIAVREPLVSDWVHSIRQPGGLLQSVGSIFTDLSESRCGRVRLIAAPPMDWHLVLDVGQGRELGWVHVDMYSLPGAVLILACAELDGALFNHAIWAVSLRGELLWKRQIAERWAGSEQFVIDSQSIWILDELDQDSDRSASLDFCVRVLDLQSGEQTRPAHRFQVAEVLRASRTCTGPRVGRVDFSLVTGRMIAAPAPAPLPPDWHDQPDHRRLTVDHVRFAKYRSALCVRALVSW